MKKCGYCKAEKPESGFHKDSRAKDGLYSQCKDCMKQYYEAHKEEKKQYYQSHKEEINQHSKQYRDTHKEELKQYNKQYNQSHKEEKNQYRKSHKEERKQANKQYNLKKTYNLSIDQYNQMLAEQNYKCKICGVDEVNAGKNGLVVDHNHKTGKIRGLLCDGCNKGIGFLKEDPALFDSAKDYLLANLFPCFLK